MNFFHNSLIDVVDDIAFDARARRKLAWMSRARAVTEPLVGPKTIRWNPPLSEISPGAVIRAEMYAAPP